MSEWFVRKPLKLNNLTVKDLNKAKQIKKYNNVSNSQIQCIYGSLLGDASLSKHGNTYCFQISHCDDQKEYAAFKAKLLNVKLHSYIKNENSFAPYSTYWKLNYFNKLFLTDVYGRCFIDLRKTITKEWLDQVDYEGIAYWFLDDGCSYKYKNARTVQVSFSTLSFIEKEIDLLIYKLNELKIKSHKVKSIHGNGIVLNINSSSVNFFMDKISPFIISSMNYKIKRCEK